MLVGIVFGESDRQHYSEACLTGSGGDLDLAPVLVDDYVVGDMHTQASAVAGGFGGKEGFEDALLYLRGHPRSVVDDFDRDDVVRGVGTQDEFSLALYGVVDDVGPHLIEFGSVGLYAWHIVGIISRDDEIRGDLGTQEHQGILQVFDHIDFLDRRLVQIRIRLDGTHDLRHGFGALSHLLEQTVDRRTGSKPPDYHRQLCGGETFGQPL